MFIVALLNSPLMRQLTRVSLVPEWSKDIYHIISGICVKYIRDDANFFINGGSAGYQNDKLLCRQRQQS